MAKTDNSCTRCGKTIPEYKTHPPVNFTNIEHPDEIYFFCSRGCKLVWLADRMKKTEESDEKPFKCKYGCGRTFDTNRGKWTHEGRCKNNPGVSLASFPKGCYTIEELREIDKLLGLTDAQIADFVRGVKNDNND